MADKKVKAIAEEPKDEPQAEPKINSGGLDELVGKTIDERMADLLADHKKMGAR